MIRYLIPFLIVFGLSSCTKKEKVEVQVKDDAWVETTAEIVNIDIFEDNTWMYSYRYEVTESTAVNNEGIPIKGPIEQHTMIEGKKPIPGQKIKMRYRKDEPIIFELLEEVKFE